MAFCVYLATRWRFGLETQHLSQEVGFEHDARRRLGRFTGVVPVGFSL